MKKGLSLILFAILAVNSYVASAQQVAYNYPFQNPSLSTEERVNDLISRMTLKEKADQLLYTAPSIPRLGIPAYNWWNEALHGVARAGYATVFPQSITIANSLDESLMFNVANAISDEARAKYHEFQRRSKTGICQGLTFWSPNINIFRDPRWGRGHETYGEDPYLKGRMGLQFVKGMQGDDPKYLKVVATAKHYAVHLGPEPLRHSFNAKVSESDLRETYLPAFRTLVVDAGAYSVMGAYNMFRDFPCCANPILYGILRNEWGFKGYIVSDCWAISDFYKFTHFAKDDVEATAIILAGYGGQQGGNAVADVLFGDCNPAGRLPVTYYKSIDQIPAFENFDMKGKTYRFFNQEPLYPFGYGLSYTTFTYSNLSIPEQVDAGATSTVLSWDSHNYVTMGIDKDGFIHLSGNMHVNPLTYFGSTKPEDVSTLVQIMEKVGTNESHCTYPNFIKNREGELIFHYRDGSSGNGNEIYNIYHILRALKQKLLGTNDKFSPGQTYIEKWGYVVDKTGTIPYTGYR